MTKYSRITEDRQRRSQASKDEEKRVIGGMDGGEEGVAREMSRWL